MVETIKSGQVNMQPNRAPLFLLAASLFAAAGVTLMTGPCIAADAWENDMASAEKNWNPSMTGAAIKHLERELATATAQKQVAKQIAANTKLAQLYEDTDFTKSVAYANTAFSIWKDNGKPNNGHQAEACRILGRFYNRSKNFIQARQYFQEYRSALINENASAEKIADATWRIAHADIDAGEPAAAPPLLRTVIAGRGQYSGNVHLLLRSRLDLAIAYWKIGHESPACLNTPDGQDLVRLLREVAKYPAQAGSKAAADVQEAQGYLKALHLN